MIEATKDYPAYFLYEKSIQKIIADLRTENIEAHIDNIYFINKRSGKLNYDMNRLKIAGEYFEESLQNLTLLEKLNSLKVNFKTERINMYEKLISIFTSLNLPEQSETYKKLMDTLNKNSP